MAKTVVSVRQDAVIGTISPRIYGHFAEHPGRCCYDGLWLGEVVPGIPTTEGFRTDVLTALQDLPVPMLRWPGGCYADHYHWRDGIGPREQRPRRLGLSCGLTVEDDNSLGTHEFLRLCELLGAEPCLAGNLGTGTPQELLDWVEYTNSPFDTTLTRDRRENGAEAPFGVKLWGVGNEAWGCGGDWDPADYAREYIRYATLLRHIQPDAELVMVGFDDAWNRTVLGTIQKFIHHVNHLSIHSYWVKGGPETEFTDEEYYALLAEADATEAFVARTIALCHEMTGGKRKIGVALDEWGVWHPEARPWGPGEMERRFPVTYEQAGTLRDAIAAAIALEGFHRQCDGLSMANLAQIVNILQSVVNTHGAHIVLTPTYHLLRMHAPHIGATALAVDLANGSSLPDGTPAVTATASLADGALTITFINKHLSEPAGVILSGLGKWDTVSGTVLTADSPRATNSVDHPNRVAPQPLAVTADASGYRLDVPPHAIANVTFSNG